MSFMEMVLLFLLIVVVLSHLITLFFNRVPNTLKEEKNCMKIKLKSLHEKNNTYINSPNSFPRLTLLKYIYKLFYLTVNSFE